MCINITKVCNICNISKPISEFFRNKGAKDGYKNQCKSCLASLQIEKYIQNTFRKCRGCLEEKSLCNFDRVSDTSFSWTCSVCKNKENTVLNNGEVKACIHCHKVLPKESFSIGDGEYGRRGRCSVCHNKFFIKRNKEKERKYKESNKEKIFAYHKKWVTENKDKVAKSQIKHRSTAAFVEKRKKRAKERYLNDITFRIRHCIRARFLSAIKQNNKGGSAVKELGCSIEDLKKYLESKFYNNPETGEVMTWENHSKDGWHIDHILPLSSFNLSDLEDVRKACHYTNLQPLWAKENRTKGDKVNHEN